MISKEIKSVLITGGTGSFGKAFAKRLLKDTAVERLVILSRDELKQFDMQNDPFFIEHAHRMRYFIGDVRDGDRLKYAFDAIDLVIHAAALKQVVAAEYNPLEAIKTNVLGAQNVVEAAVYCKVGKVIALSTDKAAAPINLYGATKLCSDKLFIAANNFVGAGPTRFAVVRYGNVFGSRGSIVPFFLQNKDKWKSFPVTDSAMTRFSLSLQQGVEFVMKCSHQMHGGELFIPRIPSYRIVDICAAIDPSKPISIVGIRPGEKIHEIMITSADIPSTYEWEGGFAIMPPEGLLNPRITRSVATAGYVKADSLKAEYNSGTNTDWLDRATLTKMIQEFAKGDL
ncbi:MAG TPA: UDP-N-acetylglucosamine 4,6-dehydratase (inverting) [Rhodoferax sp.]